jgi:hypothetical protein
MSSLAAGFSPSGYELRSKCPGQLAFRLARLPWYPVPGDSKRHCAWLVRWRLLGLIVAERTIRTVYKVDP